MSDQRKHRRDLKRQRVETLLERASENLKKPSFSQTRANPHNDGQENRLAKGVKLLSKGNDGGFREPEGFKYLQTVFAQEKTPQGKQKNEEEKVVVKIMSQTQCAQREEGGNQHQTCQALHHSKHFTLNRQAVGVNDFF